jgi:hypothetical protein
VDEFCDFVNDLNTEASNYCEKHNKKDQEAYFVKKYKKKYTFDWQKDALNYHASVKSFVEKDREKFQKAQKVNRSNESKSAVN